MHTTGVKLKNGHSYEGVLWKFKPLEGYLTLQGIPELEGEAQFYFKDMISCTTYGERVSINKIEDVDEMERAKQSCYFLRQEPKHKWY